MNKADVSLGYRRMVRNDKPCVFISYKKEDKQIAIELGDFLTNELGVDIYLDIFDTELQEAVSIENDEKIVDSVVEGLKFSDILLCVVSDKTRLSWWVPYEIGIADNSGYKIASIRTKDIDDFPSFLKTKRTLCSIDDLVEFILMNGKYGSLLYSVERKNDIVKRSTECLKKYFD